MVAQLETMPIPNWLAQLDVEVAATKLPLRELLTDSLYYPACGYDGTPIRLLNGNLVSFIYADYMTTENNLREELKQRSFKGYTPLLQRAVFSHELMPSGWTPAVVPTAQQLRRMNCWQEHAQPFAHWSVWQRDENLDDNHGAKRFSLLYMAAEMSAAYQGLYYHHRIVPKVLALICPGSFGCEWENSTSPESFFHKVITMHPDGLPSYLLTDSYNNEHACFPEYQQKICRLYPRVKLFSR